MSPDGLTFNLSVDDRAPASRRAAASLASLVLGSAVAAGNAIAAQLPAADIVAIASCRDRDDDRTARVIVSSHGFEHVSSDVRLQWIDWPDGKPRVVRGVSVATFDTGLWSVGRARVVDGESCTFRLDAHHTDSSESATFLLRPGAPGKYAIEQAPGDP